MSDDTNEGQEAQADPIEVRRLLNPAYCGGLLSEFSLKYVDALPGENASGVPFVLLFLCLPMSLHSTTRGAVAQHNYDFGLHRFLHDHPAVLVDLSNRVDGFAGTTRAALLFGLTHGVLEIDESTGKVRGNSRISNRFSEKLLGKDAVQPMRAAARLGAWFGGVSPAEVFLHLGLRPS